MRSRRRKERDGARLRDVTGGPVRDRDCLRQSHFQAMFVVGYVAADVAHVAGLTRLTNPGISTGPSRRAGHPGEFAVHLTHKGFE